MWIVGVLMLVFVYYFIVKGDYVVDVWIGLGGEQVVFGQCECVGYVGVVDGGEWYGSLGGDRFGWQYIVQ